MRSSRRGEREGQDTVRGEREEHGEVLEVVRQEVREGEEACTDCVDVKKSQKRKEMVSDRADI